MTDTELVLGLLWLLLNVFLPSMVVPTCNPSPWEIKAGELL